MLLNEREIESCYLGQFIPVQYHHNMLMDQNRMKNFRAAIEQAVFPGAKVLELGGGTGVLSWFAAQKAEKVWCVEYNPDLVAEARRMLAQNAHGDKVQVIHADAFEYLPPEPVDIVICEMIHVAMLREKQVEVIESFKKRYRERFADAPLPRFIPEAVIMAAQPLQQDYCFEGYHAPIVQFQPHTLHPDTLELAEPSVYSILDFSQPTDTLIRWQGEFRMERDGKLNAVRFITKNILAICQQQGSTIDWLNHYMVLPLAQPMSLQAGERVQLAFQYRAGSTIASLQNNMRVQVIDQASQEVESLALAIV